MLAAWRTVAHRLLAFSAWIFSECEFAARSFIDGQKPDLQFTRQNDFCSQAILVLNDSDVPT
jgi:hypothetical protein